MIMFRMPMAWPPNPTRKREAKGRNQCFRTLPTKAHERWGRISKLYAPAMGKTPRTMPKNQARRIPSHM